MALVRTPVQDFCGCRFGVRFNRGCAKTEDPAKLEYFKAQGYLIEGEVKEAPKKRGRRVKND